MKSLTTALFSATLAVGFAALLAILPLDDSTAPIQAPGTHGAHEPSGGVHLTIEPAEAGQGRMRLDLQATIELDVAFLRIEVQLPDGGQLRLTEPEGTLLLDSAY